MRGGLMEPPGFIAGIPSLTPALGGVWAKSHPENHSSVPLWRDKKSRCRQMRRQRLEFSPSFKNSVLWEGLFE